MTVLDVDTITLAADRPTVGNRIALNEIVIPARSRSRSPRRVSCWRCRPNINAFTIGIVDVVIEHLYIIHRTGRTVNGAYIYARPAGDASVDGPLVVLKDEIADIREVRDLRSIPVPYETKPLDRDVVQTIGGRGKARALNRPLGRDLKLRRRSVITW